MERTTLNRFTANHISWLGNLRELCRERGDDELIPFIKETLYNAKKFIPLETQVRSGMAKYHIMTEFTKMENWEFGKMCLYFASASIYDTAVLKDGDKYVYYAKVDNTVLFYPLLFADFLVNTKVLKECNDAEFVIVIDEADNDNDPFVHLMKTAFKEYYKDVPVHFIGK